MKICLVSPADPEPDAFSYLGLADLLGERHEVVLIEAPEPSPELAAVAFAGEDHRRSAAVLAEIERACAGAAPDYVEVCDRGAPGLVPLGARRCGHPLLDGARIGVRVVGAKELTALHDGTIGEPRMRRAADLEREQLRLADVLVWPGGDLLDLHRRHYRFELPEAARIALPFPVPDSAEPPARGPDEPLRILYCGALRTGGGAIALAEACLRLPRDDWSLTMIGADTPTAPGGRSVRMTIEAMRGGDPRLELLEPPGPEGRRRHLARHDLLVIPGGFEVWPTEALAAMAAGLPILAAPVGGLTEIVRPGSTGWFADGADPAAIRAGLLRLLERRDELERVRASGEIRSHLLRLADPERILAGYEELLGADRPPARPRRRAPGAGTPVTGIVPYHRAAAHVEEAVDSLLAQTHREVDAIVVNDGSFEEADAVLGRLAEKPSVRVVTQLNRGEAGARNLAARLARGEYLVMLDADNVLEPQFVARALEALARVPELAYVSSWLRFIGPDGSPISEPAGYAALGNAVLGDESENWDGDSLALLPRRLFAEEGYAYPETSATHPDWELYRTLRDDGRFGAVVPEFLARYRVLPSSLLRTYSADLEKRGGSEMLSRRLLRETSWMAGA